MKKNLLILFFLIPFLGNSQESYGKTANLGLGLGYRNIYRASIPIIHFNYEFDVAKNFTLAPFVTLIHYRYTSNWKNVKYRYNSWIIPIGVKGSYYFDELFNLDSKFDIYGGGSVGFNIRSAGWDDGYNGPEYEYYNNFSPLYLNLNIGAEFHINEKIGLVLDLSTGISTFGIAIH
jgi:hypothetical protein